MKQYALKRMILPVSVLATGLVASLFITGSVPRHEEGNVMAPSGSGSNLEYQAGDTQLFSSLLSSSSLSSNLTERFAHTIVREVAENNPDALLAGIDPNLLVGSLNEDALGRALSEPLPFSAYTRDDIRISSDTSREAQIRYLEQFFQINKRYFGNVPWTLAESLDEWVSNENLEPLYRYRSAIPGAVNDLLQLSSPENLAFLHLQTLNFWEKTLVFYDALLSLDQDPVKFLIAFREAPNILNETIFIQNSIEQIVRALAL